MNSAFLTSLWADYHIGLSLIVFVAIMVISIFGGRAVSFVPALREAGAMNAAAFSSKMEKPNYAANQAWNRKWGLIDQAVVFLVIMPFCLTIESQPWWRVLLDMFVILMVYDFVYYLSHRFLFHDSAFFGGPLKWMHAYHHRQHNPCRRDSSYIHPLEVAIGIGLFVGTIFVLSLFMGDFHVVTVIVTWIAFSEINQHNHNLWKADRFPFRYLNYASKMHHIHHARFTGGNYATISLLYDWMFGTLDDGDGYGRYKRAPKRAKAAATVPAEALPEQS